MGRHSAPRDGDHDEDDLGGGIDLLALHEEHDATSTGRHVRIDAAPTLGHEFVFGAPAETATEQTTSIPLEQIETAARADAGHAPVTGVRAAELLPILPGEAVVPPPVDDAEPVAVVGTDEAVETDAVDAVETEAVETDAVATATQAPPASRPAPTPRPAPARPPRETALHRGAHASAADLALLRSDGSLRTRCIAAFLAPFVLYAVVLLVVGASGRHWLIWIWVPTVVACVAAGSLLDVAHKKAAPAQPPDPGEADPAQPQAAAPVVVEDPATDGLDAEEPDGGEEQALTDETPATDEAAR